MNQTFSLARFGRLLSKYFSDNRTQLLLNVALLTGILLIGAILFYRDLPFQADRNRSISLFIFGWPIWYVFTWQQVEVLNNRERAMSYLLQPASQLEKFLLIWLVSGVGFLLVFFGLFAAIDAVGVAYVNGRDWTSEQVQAIRNVDGLLTIKPFFRSDHGWPPAQALVLIGLLHPFCLAAFLFVKRYSLPLVGVLILVILAAGFFLNSSFLTWLLDAPKSVQAIPFGQTSVEYSTGKESLSRRLELPQPLGDSIRYATGITGIILLYIIAFFRLKEREV